MDYLKKYITYKNKYLKLKKQLGGANVIYEDAICEDYYLPCDLTHKTEYLTYTRETIRRLSGIQNIPDSIQIKSGNNPQGGYCQDPYIELYNGKNYYDIYIDPVDKSTHTICDSDECIYEYNRKDAILPDTFFLIITTLPNEN
jgi:hypothetical protein